MIERNETDDENRVSNPQQNDGHMAELQETAPLLRQAQRTKLSDKIMLVCLALVLIIGFSIGTYLLCVEGGGHTPERFFFISRRDWSAQPDTVNVSRLLLPSRRLLLMQTNSNMCSNESGCFEELRNLEREHMIILNEPIILYNFIVGGDGRIYEGRGWKYRSTFQDNNEDILTVAFLGNYDDIPPNFLQRDGLKAFLDYAVMRNNLEPCFDILVRTSLNLLDLAYAIETQEKIENRC